MRELVGGEQIGGYVLGYLAAKEIPRKTIAARSGTDLSNITKFFNGQACISLYLFFRIAVAIGRAEEEAHRKAV